VCDLYFWCKFFFCEFDIHVYIYVVCAGYAVMLFHFTSSFCRTWMSFILLLFLAMLISVDCLFANWRELYKCVSVVEYVQWNYYCYFYWTRSYGKNTYFIPHRSKYFLITLFSNTCKLDFSLKARNHVSHLYRATSKLHNQINFQ
jgi:hypothetical protein